MASASTATVTIDRHYFETLLRRASHTGAETAPSDRQLSPSEILVLQRTARKYENLRRNLIRGGVEDGTIDLLSRDDSDIQQGNQAPTDDASRVTPTTYQTPSVTQARLKARPGISDTNGAPYNGRGDSYNYGDGYHNHGDQTAWADEEPDEGLDYDEETTVDGPIGANYVTSQKSRNGQYDIKCTRTVLLSNLAEGTTHADVTDAVRGGLLLDVFLRPHDRCVALSFLHAADARAFFDHVRKNDLYIKNKRVIAKWNERQFTLAGHAIGKISGGATRNLVLRNINRSRHTEESIRDDLDHIFNLVVIKVEFIGYDCHIKTNSINYALFARTCMMSRGKYRGTKIEYGPDECAQPYDIDRPTKLQAPRREAPPLRKGSNMSNRFQLLNIDGEDSDEENQLPLSLRTKNGVL
ncbi:Negative regulator of differentiation 1 [Coniochaeta hoffmannii]|uniref:Negative regulator of differentiation 1 n=1 Tax=Coniochaeta hoffmannii TaxID=91930 RepID=A0AA38R973_9PEZI|nr:Negative regulator of differentiation 1 [Coniochaeta hoffmannii]